MAGMTKQEARSQIYSVMSEHVSAIDDVGELRALAKALTWRYADKLTKDQLVKWIEQLKQNANVAAGSKGKM